MPKNNFTFKDFKELEYDERTPMNFILSDLMYKGWIDTNYIMECYTNALERERHLSNTKFEEACVNLCQILSGNFKGEHEDEMYKRAIHTYNLTKRLPEGIYNEQYGYTKEDERQWDEFCINQYGTDLKE